MTRFTTDDVGVLRRKLTFAEFMDVRPGDVIGIHYDPAWTIPVIPFLRVSLSL